MGTALMSAPPPPPPSTRGGAPAPPPTAGYPGQPAGAYPSGVQQGGGFDAQQRYYDAKQQAKIQKQQRKAEMDAYKHRAKAENMNITSLQREVQKLNMDKQKEEQK